MNKEAIEALKELEKLRQSGTLTEEEFEQQKAMILKKANEESQSGESEKKKPTNELDPPDEDALTKSKKIVDYREILENWTREREKEREKFINKRIKKIKTEEIRVTRRVPVINKYGEEVDINELINRLCEEYQKQGFHVEKGDKYLVVHYEGSVENEIGVNISSVSVIAFIKRPKTWQIVVRGEMDYWTKKFDRIAGYMFWGILFLLVFWPCLFCLAGAFEVDEEALKQMAEEHVLQPLLKTVEDFRVLEL